MSALEVDSTATCSAAATVTSAMPAPRLCGLDGCTLVAWHPGLCAAAALNSRRCKSIPKQYDATPAPPPSQLLKRAREEGKLPPAAIRKKPSPPEGLALPPKQPRKRKGAGGTSSATSELRPAKQQEPRQGTRGGTRSRGEPVWEPEDVPSAPVSVAVGVGEDGQVLLRVAAARKPSMKGLANLRDFLAQGKSDPFANDSCRSFETERKASLHAQRGIKWGCACNGNVLNGGMELQCRRCSLTFHAKCERLDYTLTELRKMESAGTFACTACEQQDLIDAGYDPAHGRFVLQCRYCTRSFDADDHKTADKHGSRCAAQLSARQWSCPCNGNVGKSTMATQCKSCSQWFHGACKSQQRNSWAADTQRDSCLACERKASLATAENVSNRRSVGGDNGDGVRPISRAEKAASLIGLNLGNSDGTPMKYHDIGTLADERIHVKQSTLGAAAGLGLFAGCQIKQNEVVCSYSGRSLYREHLPTDPDTSYVVRLPNSGGALLDGKPFADAIRANRTNPADNGRFYPVAGAPEWHQGAACMANDPRDSRLNNAILRFVKPEGGTKALRDLALVRPVLVATRTIEPDEEVFYSYGSSRPFEAMRREMHKEQQKLQRKSRGVCRLVWLPYEEGGSHPKA